jgi:hypothetical protein
MSRLFSDPKRATNHSCRSRAHPPFILPGSYPASLVLTRALRSTFNKTPEEASEEGGVIHVTHISLPGEEEENSNPPCMPSPSTDTPSPPVSPPLCTPCQELPPADERQESWHAHTWAERTTPEWERPFLTGWEDDYADAMDAGEAYFDDVNWEVVDCGD